MSLIVPDVAFSLHACIACQGGFIFVFLDVVFRRLSRPLSPLPDVDMALWSSSAAVSLALTFVLSFLYTCFMTLKTHCLFSICS